MSKRVYVASPFFNDAEMKPLLEVENILRERGLIVYTPREHGDPAYTFGTAAWSLHAFEEDRKHIDASDLMVMVYHDAYSDTGTAWECGYAFGTHKPVIVVHVGPTSNIMVHEGSHANVTIEELKTYDFDLLPSKRYEGQMR